VSQSTILVGSLLGAFVVYLAMNNRLSVYWGILSGSAAGAGSPSPSTSPATGTLLNPFAPGAGTGTVTPLQ
jgi:hypothetical protein